jgi:hypothetical protein
VGSAAAIDAARAGSFGDDVGGPIMPARAHPHGLALALNCLLAIPVDIRLSGTNGLAGLRIGHDQRNALNLFQRSPSGFTALGAPGDQVCLLRF